MFTNRRKLLAVVFSSVMLGTAGCGGRFADDTDDQSPEVDLEISISGPDDEQPFFERTDIEAVAEVDERNGYVVPVQLTDSGQETAIDTFDSVGADGAPEDASITVAVDGDVTVENTFGISPELADAITMGEWDGEFILMFDEQEQAETVYEGLRMG